MKTKQGFVLLGLCMLTYSALQAQLPVSWTLSGGPYYARHVVELSSGSSGSGTSIYAANYVGGFFKSTNAGASWSKVLGANYTFTIATIPDNPSIVLAGCGDGIRRILDGGQTWTLTNNALQVTKFGFAPSNPSLVYAGLYNAVLDRTLWKSLDGGQTWIREATFGGNALDITDIVVHPSNSEIVFVSGWYQNERGVWRTLNGGIVWEHITQSLPDQNIGAMALSTTNPSVVYAATRAGDRFPGSQDHLSPDPLQLFYRSPDGGNTWFATQCPYAVDMAVDPQDGNTVFICNQNGVYKSTNAGDTWAPLNNGIVNAVAYSLGFVKGTNQTLLVGTTKSLYRSTNSGNQWEESVTGMLPVPLTRLDIVSGKAFACTGEDPAWANQGLTLGTIHKRESPTSNWKMVYATSDYLPQYVWSDIEVAQTNSNVAYVTGYELSIPLGMSVPAIFRTLDAGNTWSSVYHDGEFSSSSFSAVAVHPTNPGVVFALNGFRRGDQALLTSFDYGATWTAQTQDPTIRARAFLFQPGAGNAVYLTGSLNGLTPFLMRYDAIGGQDLTPGLSGNDVRSISIDPSNTNILFVSTRTGVFKSTNDGASWSNQSSGIPNRDTTVSVLVHPISTDVVYAAVNEAGSGNCRVYRSTNGANSWTELSTGIPASIKARNLAIDVNNPNVVYLATNAGVYQVAHIWSGRVTSSVSWKTNEEHLVEGALSVPGGVALTIQPGAIVKMLSGAQIVVEGAIVATGTPQSRVTFSSVNAGETWSGIASGSYPPTISLNNCNISNVWMALNVGTFTNLTVDNCIFSNCSIGINIFPTAHSPIPTMQITNNAFSNFPINCTGIAINQYSDILIANNALTGPVVKGTGMFLNSSAPRLVGNTIQSFKSGFVCVSGSPAVLEAESGPGNNFITNNTYAVSCTESDAILGGDYGGNSICYNSAVDVWVTKCNVLATNDSWASNGCDEENPPGTFVIVDGLLKYQPCAGSCGGAGPIAGETKEIGLEGGDPSMTSIPALVQQAMRARARGNNAQADALLRAIIANGSMIPQWKQWALGHLLAVEQNLRRGNLASYFNTIASSQPALLRRARSLLPASFINEGSFDQAMAAYDANIRNYHNSSEARAGLFGKFTYQLFNQRDTTQARALLNRLAAEYPQSIEKEVAELQISGFRLSSSPSSSLTGGVAKGANAATTTASLQNIPTEFALSQNYPNPFNPTTTINFDVPVTSHVTIKLFDLLGRQVQTLLDESVEAGSRQVVFDASTLSSGLYFYKMQNGAFTCTRKAIVVK